MENETAIIETHSSIVVQDFTSIVASIVNEAQFSILMGKTPKEVIKRRPGKGGKTFSYVPHGYVVSVLNRAFGFSWDWEIIPQADGKLFVYLEGMTVQSKGRNVETPSSVIVHGKLTVRIHNPADPSQVFATIIKTSSGEKEFVPGMTWGSMVKSAESDALKKAASRLGVALDLYWQDADDEYIIDEQGNVILQSSYEEQQAAKHRQEEEQRRKKADAILMSSAGKTVDEIAAELGAPIVLVRRWIGE